MDFQRLAFLLSQATFSPTSLKIVIEVKASGPPHVLQLSLGVSKGMLRVEYFCPTTVVGGKQGHAPCNIPLLRKSLHFSLVEFCGENKTFTMLNVATLSYGVITAFKTVQCMLVVHYKWHLCQWPI